MENSSGAGRPIHAADDLGEPAHEAHPTFLEDSDNFYEDYGFDPPHIVEHDLSEEFCYDGYEYPGDDVQLPPGQRYYPWDGSEYQNLEDFEQYRPGGHHPVVLGDLLGEDSRFEVWHKLGQGTYGLIWLCRDLLKGKFCAVKVLRAELSGQSDKLPELRVQNMLGGISPEEAWQNHIAMPLETFTQRGPNGEHICIVTRLLGPSITSSRRHNWNDTSLLKDICFQLVEGMDFMHRHGLGHGDFRPPNILFKTTLEDLTEEEMEIYLPDPEAYEIYAVDEPIDGEPPCGPHAPLYAIEPLELHLEDECITKEIAIIDFGVAFETACPNIPTAIPDNYAAPECHPELGSQQPSIGSDLWALGCTMVEVLCGSTPFELFGGFNFGEVELSLGPMPEPYRSKFIESSSFYSPDSQADHGAHLLWDKESLSNRRERVTAQHGIDDNLYGVIGYEACNPHPNTMWRPPKTISASVAASADRYERPAFPVVEGTSEFSIRRRLEREAIPGAVDLLRQVLRWFPEDRVGADKLLVHEWFEGRHKSTGVRRADL
ncbi:hypothetical protein KVR01_012103 [Diaporthe batatas]|uniref:uncharacterized protein n=1 Tax=Diaporthe batatas TaxID=748121 RepID=UPI001D042457|nr:uncharacterized protein KVR01_012103 [Diaporthe batatas]KAG8158342.1 hypothetical protein KVR01_012103 [Diaporthe batatas]